MRRDDAGRFLGVFIPFCVMVTVYNLLGLWFSRMGWGYEANTGAFLIAVAAAILIFAARPGPGKFSTDENEDEPKTEYETLPIREVSLLSRIEYFFLSAALLTAAEYPVALIMRSFDQPAEAVTPFYVVSVILIHPLTEEFVFRRLFYGELRGMNPFFGILMQAVMFALMHGSLPGMVYALVCGIILGSIYEKSGSFAAVFLSHVFVNARSLIYNTLLSGREGIQHTADIVIVSVGFLASVVLMIGRKRRENKKTEEAATV